MGVSGAMIASWESGKRIPKEETLKRLADALDINTLILRGLTDFNVSEAMNNIFKNLSLNKWSENMIEFIDGDWRIIEIISYLQDLNSEGIDEACKQIENLTCVPKYKKK